MKVQKLKEIANRQGWYLVPNEAGYRVHQDVTQVTLFKAYCDMHVPVDFRDIKKYYLFAVFDGELNSLVQTVLTIHGLTRTD